MRLLKYPPITYNVVEYSDSCQRCGIPVRQRCKMRLSDDYHKRCDHRRWNWHQASKTIKTRATNEMMVQGGYSGLYVIFLFVRSVHFDGIMLGVMCWACNVIRLWSTVKWYLGLLPYTSTRTFAKWLHMLKANTYHYHIRNNIYFTFIKTHAFKWPFQSVVCRIWFW